MTNIPTVPEGFVTVAEVRSMLHDARHPGATYSFGTVALDSAVWMASMCQSFGFLSDGARLLGYTLGQHDERIKVIEGDLLELLRSGDLVAWLDDRNGRIDRILAGQWSGGSFAGHLGMLFLTDGNHPGPRVLFKTADIQAMMSSQPGQSTSRTAPASPRAVAEFLAELDREFAGKHPPAIGIVDVRGREKFGDRWRKKMAERRNDLGPGHIRLYPHLHSTTSGPRRAR